MSSLLWNLTVNPIVEAIVGQVTSNSKMSGHLNLHFLLFKFAFFAVIFFQGDVLGHQ